MISTRIRMLIGLALGLLFVQQSASAAGWKAGTAKVAITPKKSTWMAGYGARDHPSEGAVHDLWAKALVLEDPSGRKAALVTLDVCGIDRATSLRIRDALRSKHALTYDRVILSCSHTHCGPVVGQNLITMYKLDNEQRDRVAEYTKLFEESVVHTVDQAITRLEPVELAWETGRADFAVNRRNNKETDIPTLRARNALEGPVDHDVPVLRIRSEDKKPVALIFGYACHCTVLSFYKFCGDYAGFAQNALESRYPGAQAMFVAGCGADQNPLPRRSIELAEGYGKQLAEAVERVVETPMRPIRSSLESRYKEIPLRFGELPSLEQLRADAKSSNHPVASRAKMLLGIHESKGSLPTSYPYPLQLWRLGDLDWIILGGEVVVDYSLRLKRNLGSSDTWVSSYCNDVMAYIPSARVLKEGGYEGATSMIYYGQPTTWSSDVERQIIDGLTELLKAP
jgi:hypothetical protein